MKVSRVYVNGKFVTQALTGVQRYALEVARRLEMNLIISSPSNPLAEYRVLEHTGRIEAHGYRWARRGMLGHLWEQLLLPRHVPSEALLWSPCGTGPLLKSKQVVTLHDLASLEHPEWFSRSFSAWYQFLIPKLVKRVRKVITVSQYTKQQIVNLFNLDPEQVYVIANGVDVRFSPRAESEEIEVREIFGIPSPHYILTLSSIEPRKNLWHMLEAWEIAQEQLPEEVWLVIAGAKGNQLVFQEVSLDHLPPRVYMTGRVPDKYLPALYSGALAFAYVSVYEGFGLPPLEAMASGTPTLTGNRTALPEVVGNAGLLVDPYDVEAIAWGLKRLVDDSVLREKLRRKGLERAKRFSWDKTAKLTWKVLQEAAQEG